MSVPKTIALKNNLPWWTLGGGFLLFQASHLISIQFKVGNGISAVYLPSAIGIVLINWWGPARVVPLMYISSFFASWIWGVQFWYQRLLFPLPETFMLLLSWYLYTYKANGRYWLPNTRSLLLFFLLGILIPATPELLSLHLLYVFTGQNTFDTFWIDFARNCLGEFTSSFGIAIVLLYYLTPVVERWKLTRFDYQVSLKRIGLTPLQWVEVLSIGLVLFVSVFFVDFKRYWFLYGVFSLFVAIRGGFGIAILVNLYIYIITYILPSLFSGFGNIHIRYDQEYIYIFLGIGVLYLFGAVTGRILNDLLGYEKRLKMRNSELEQLNRELDRFVYSVSHDLSAPLKSILGMAHIGKMDFKNTGSNEYFSRIETSVQKAEAFIRDVLDYSRNKRLEVVFKSLSINNLVKEIVDDIKFVEGFDKVQFDFTTLMVNEITTDKIRLKIILNNLLTNAIKYQKTTPGHNSMVTISSFREGSFTKICVADNGEGIPPHLQVKIFEMFYRGHERSKGSGLGLYIAKEAATQMGSTLTVLSEPGKGTQFILTIPHKMENRFQEV